MFYTNCFTIDYKEMFTHKIHGRVITDDDSMILSWTNSGFEFRFKGERIVISFKDYISHTPVYVKVYTDGKPQRFAISGAQPKILIDCKRDREHSVKLLRISEGDEYLHFTDVTVYGKLPVPLTYKESKKLKLEFLGDSITTGWGVCATGAQNTYNTFEQDSTKSYAYMTAELLDAEIRTEAIGGQGVWRNCAKAKGIQFKEIFDMSVRGISGYDHSQWIPDLIVLNCGTNDEPGGTTEEEMYREGNILLNKVRDAYPNTKIVWIYGMMNSKFIPTFKKLVSDKQKEGDKDIYFLPLKPISREKNEVGAVGHPNVNASISVSRKLAQFIKRTL